MPAPQYHTRFHGLLIWGVSIIGPPMILLAWIDGYFLEEGAASAGIVFGSQLVLKTLLGFGAVVDGGYMAVHLFLWNWESALQSLGILALMFLSYYAAAELNPAIAM